MINSHQEAIDQAKEYIDKYLKPKGKLDLLSLALNVSKIGKLNSGLSEFIVASCAYFISKEIQEKESQNNEPEIS